MSNIIWHFKSFEDLTLHELYEILQVRNEVFIVEQNCPYQDLDGDDEKALHFWASDQDGILAYTRLFQPGIKYKDASIGRVLTTKRSRGRKLGRILMTFSLMIIDNRFSSPSVRISAQQYLFDFYTSLGFNAQGEPYLEDDIPHVEMLLLGKGTK